MIQISEKHRAVSGGNCFILEEYRERIVKADTKEHKEGETVGTWAWIAYPRNLEALMISLVNHRITACDDLLEMAEAVKELETAIKGLDLKAITAKSMD